MVILPAMVFGRSYFPDRVLSLVLIRIWDTSVIVNARLQQCVASMRGKSIWASITVAWSKWLANCTGCCSAVHNYPPLKKTMICYSFRKIRILPNRILSYPLHTNLYYFSKVHFRIIYPFTTSFPKLSLSWKLSALDYILISRHS
jgi:hypothetical protein